jgi:hypothetical protein
LDISAPRTGSEEDDEGPAKRVKVEEAPAPAVEVKEEDSDEEVDFEDV